MEGFYTSVEVLGGKILYRGYNKEGYRVQVAHPFKPTLYVPTKKETGWKTLSGENVLPTECLSIQDAKEYIQQYDDITNYKIYGNTNWKYAFIHQEFLDDVPYEMDFIRTAYIDIEVGAEEGFPSIEAASDPITAITLYFRGKYHVFGIGKYRNDDPSVIYYDCRDEESLLKKFHSLWTGDINCDIITGWNVRFFDMPYLINRIIRVLGQDFGNSMSPWKRLYKKKIEVRGREQQAYQILGIEILDYLELYKTFTYTNQESYKLDHIAHVELGERKLDYSEYGNLNALWKEDYQKYLDYNVKDVELIVRLEEKMKLMETAVALSYSMHCNYSDCFAQVRMWTSCIQHYLLAKKIVAPKKDGGGKSEKFEGAYVKEVVPGSYDWVCSFDLNSLYPHLIMQYNISPETLLGYNGKDRIVDYLDEKYETDPGVIQGANGTYYSREEGFLPELMRKFYNDRKVFKKQMLEYQSELEAFKKSGKTDPKEQKRLENNISKYSNLQMARKISLNSAYGAIGNEHFFLFDLRLAEAITKGGQLSIRWAEKDINKYLNKTLKTDGEDYIVASDTDSLYITFSKLVEQVYEGKNPTNQEVVDFLDKVCDGPVQKVIDESYQNLANYMNSNQMMFMKREGISSRGIFRAKKNYILNVYNNEGVAYAEPKLKMMGIEAVKSSTPAWCRDKIKESLKIIMNEDNPVLIKYISKSRKEFDTLEPHQVAFPRGCKNLSKYSDRTEVYTKGTPIHVRGSLLYNKHAKKYIDEGKYSQIYEGDKVKFLYLYPNNPLMEDVIAFPDILPEEMGLHRFIDYKKQFDKSFLEPIKSITSVIGWETEEVVTLDSLFDF